MILSLKLSLNFFIRRIKIKSMRVCYFGTYEGDYIRNRTIIKGLKLNGVDVVECHCDVWKRKKIKTGLKPLEYTKLLILYATAYIILALKFFSLRNVDTFIVGYPGFFDIFFLKFLCIFKREKVIFDAFLSLYDTFVSDRQMVERNSFAAKIIWSVDKKACDLADKVLLDTEANIEYFFQEFNLRKEKLKKIPIGANEDEVAKKKISEKKDVFFFGKYIPLQGVDVIIRAAKILEDRDDLSFHLVGDGQEKRGAINLVNRLDLKNITFHDFMPYEELIRFLSNSDIGLGIFGTTGKANRVIPNKVYEMMANKIAFITGRSQAAREELEEGTHCLFVKFGDPEELSKKILTLADDEDLRKRLVKNSFDLFNQKFSRLAIGKSVKEVIDDL